MPDQAGADPPGAGLVGMLVGFGRALRSAGIGIGTGDTLTFTAAAAALDPGNLGDLYWAGRTTLVTRRDQLPVYDRVFRRYFLDEGGDEDADPVRRALKAIPQPSVVEIPATEPGEERDGEHEAKLGLQGSTIEVLRHKAFPACTSEELAAVRRMMATIRLAPPRRRTRRTEPSPAGRRPDLRRTVRETLRTHGEPAELHRRTRRLRRRRLVLLLDVSGSMADYSRNLVQFAYSARRADTKVEAFCFGTRLTRITRALDRRRPDDALARAAGAVFDWEGGTRIGDSLDAFVRDWGRRGLCRGAIVVVCSDGLDRGDPEVLAKAMERLARLSHRIVWLNPHRGDGRDYEPSTLGMMVAAPHVDLVLSGHDLASLERFAARLAELG